MWRPTPGSAVVVPRAAAATAKRAVVVSYRKDGLLHRFVRFGLVGAAGMIVNTIVFLTACETGLPILAAAFLSMEVATVFNFAAAEKAVFLRRHRGCRWVRAVSFFAVATAGFLVTGPLIVLLIEASVPPVLANVFAIGTLMVARFAVADRIIWSPGPRSPRRQQRVAFLGSPEHQPTGLPDG